MVAWKSDTPASEMTIPLLGSLPMVTAAMRNKVGLYPRQVVQTPDTGMVGVAVELQRQLTGNRDLVTVLQDSRRSISPNMIIIDPDAVQPEIAEEVTMSENYNLSDNLSEEGLELLKNTIGERLIAHFSLEE